MTVSVKKRACLLALLVAFSLTACGSDDDDKAKAEKAAKEEKKEEKKEAADKKKQLEAIPICPQVAIVRDLEIIKDYGTETPAPEQLVAQARMKHIQGDCEYTETGVDIKFDLSFIAAKGPRLGGLHTSFPYFVAIVDPEGKPISKERLTKEVRFSSDGKLSESEESLHVSFPLAKDHRQSGPNYQVLTGFQLTKEQLEESKTAN